MTDDDFRLDRADRLLTETVGDLLDVERSLARVKRMAVGLAIPPAVAPTGDPAARTASCLEEGWDTAAAPPIIGL